MRVCVVDFPFESPKLAIHLVSLLEIMAHIDIDVNLITGNYPEEESLQVRKHLVSDIGILKYSSVGRSLRYSILQFKMFFKFLRNAKNIDCVISFHDCVNNLLTLLLAKIMRKKIGIYVGGSSRNIISKIYKGTIGAILYYIISGLENLSHRLADLIIPLSREMIEFQNLHRFKKKTSPVDGSIYIDTTKFRLVNGIEDRDNIVAFVGRLSAEKGITNFLEMMGKPSIGKPIQFWILGDGYLRNLVTKKVSKTSISPSPKYFGFVENSELPSLLQEIKFLVISSYTEGLPTIAMEAMSCGAIVISNRIGGIPDLITDGQTGFILENNNPVTIARGIEKASFWPNLPEIQERAAEMIRTKYSLDGAVERWRKIMQLLVNT